MFLWSNGVSEKIKAHLPQHPLPAIYCRFWWRISNEIYFLIKIKVHNFEKVLKSLFTQFFLGIYSMFKKMFRIFIKKNLLQITEDGIIGGKWVETRFYSFFLSFSPIICC